MDDSLFNNANIVCGGGVGVVFGPYFDVQLTIYQASLVSLLKY